jgi:hypothetical protein
MLARSGQLPTSGDYAYEVKWDGFRAIVSTEGKLRVRGRRGWDMTEHVEFLAQLPVRAVLDGELVALDEDGKPDFPELCHCVLMRHPSTALTYMVFDVLSVDGRNVMSLPCAERRRILEDLGPNDRSWRTPEAFDDGEALWAAVGSVGDVSLRRAARPSNLTGSDPFAVPAVLALEPQRVRQRLVSIAFRHRCDPKRFTAVVHGKRAVPVRAGVEELRLPRRCGRGARVEFDLLGVGSTN